MNYFYSPSASNATVSPSVGFLAQIPGAILASPLTVALSVLLGTVSLTIATRLLSGRSSEIVGGTGAKNVWMLPYWFPVIGHGFWFFWNQDELLSKAREQSMHGIFALNIGTVTVNFISDPTLARGALGQKESELNIKDSLPGLLTNFFGIPKRMLPKIFEHWEPFNTAMEMLMREPSLSTSVGGTIRNLESIIPTMISFLDSPIDQQPWERAASASLAPPTSVEVDLFALIRDVLGRASIPGIFGSALLDNSPYLLHDMYELDKGMMPLICGLPIWTPWPKVTRAHIARRRVLEAMTKFQVELDARQKGETGDPRWGDMDDVGAFILRRNELYREHGFPVGDRLDHIPMWALLANAPALAYWQLFYILATPDLVASIRNEIKPHVTISQSPPIGKIFSPPTLKIAHQELSKSCPLLKATYLESLRLCAQPWSVRKVTNPVSLSTSKTAPSPTSYHLPVGDWLTIPHELHMSDPTHFPDPKKFIPGRFLVKDDEGNQKAEMGTIRPYGGGHSLCKGRILAERECLAVVAGILMMWEIEPVGEGWVVPRQKKKAGVSVPVVDTRVRIRRREVEVTQE